MQFAARRRQIAPPAFYDKWAFPFNGRSHLKQCGKTLIQANRIEFPDLSNAIRQKVRLVALTATHLQGIYRESTGADSPLEGGRTLLYYNIHHGDYLKIRMDKATFSYTSLQHRQATPKATPKAAYLAMKATLGNTEGNT